MAALIKGKRIVKLLTPEQVNRMLAEGVLVRQGIELDGKCRVEVQYAFTNGNRNFDSARVEIIGS